jgi:FtsP/CotA-like multicopper oxidase with cupredoxin domain
MNKPETENSDHQSPESGPAPAEEAPSSRRDFLRNALGATSALALSPFVESPAEAQTPAQAPFANPAGVASKNGKLRAVMELNSEMQRSVPNVAQKIRLRYFQGWDIDNPSVKAPDLSKSDAVTPGPTLRVKVGDQVQIAFFNKINDTQFPYTFDTDKTHGSYGCDMTSNPGLYPGPDEFPNCFHGSSTANIHFHGTHASPDGVADNVLVQVMPNKSLVEKDWMPIFEKIFAGPVPTSWNQLPQTYRTRQQQDVSKIDKSLWQSNVHQIMAGQWPQYIAGAFPHYFDIPDHKSGKYKMGQSPGTHWYHAHKHGSTSLHILSGLAGALIIEGDYDQFLRSYYGLGAAYPAAFEKIMVVQNIDPNQNLTRGSANNARTGVGQQLVNGMNAPVIEMAPNEVQLWRIIAATVGSTFWGWIYPNLFQTGGGFQFKQTAMDGVQFSPNNYKNQPFLSGQVPNALAPPNNPGLLLSAGNRADVLVQAPSTPSNDLIPFKSNNVTLFYVKVTASAPPNPSVGKGFPSDSQWPQIPVFLKDLGPPQGYPHYVSFGWDAEPQRNQTGGGRLTTTSAGLLNAPPRFTIDNKQFEEFGPIIDQCMPLNGLQDWVLENHTTIPHPFHIHINPFQVMEVATPVADNSGGANYTIYKPASDQVWQDVIAIPAAVSVNGQVVPGRVRIRHQFVDFTGTYVLHCHILAHEDRGMMQLVRVVQPAQYPSACQNNIPQHH